MGHFCEVIRAEHGGLRDTTLVVIEIPNTYLIDGFRKKAPTLKFLQEEMGAALNRYVKEFDMNRRKHDSQLSKYL